MVQNTPTRCGNDLPTLLKILTFDENVYLRHYIYIYIYALLRSSRLPQALFFSRKSRFRDFMTCFSSAEVFQAAAGAFFFRKNDVSGIL